MSNRENVIAGSVHTADLHAPGFCGFTLIELLMVIGLIGILMVALLPMMGIGMARSEEALTRSRLQTLKVLIEAFGTSPFGNYPPDDFHDLPNFRPLNVKPDTTNAGIESCLIFLHREDHRGKTIEDHAALKNTDNDHADVVLGKLGVTDKLELVDAWGMPIAYFRHDGYGRTQDYVAADGTTVGAIACKKDGSFINPRSYQLLSAGPDQKFGTSDDLFSKE